MNLNSLFRVSNVAIMTSYGLISYFGILFCCGCTMIQRKEWKLYQRSCNYRSYIDNSYDMALSEREKRTWTLNHGYVRSPWYWNCGMGLFCWNNNIWRYATMLALVATQYSFLLDKFIDLLLLPFYPLSYSTIWPSNLLS